MASDTVNFFEVKIDSDTSSAIQNSGTRRTRPYDILSQQGRDSHGESCCHMCSKRSACLDVWR